MPRKPRVLEPNRAYHVYNRRTDRQPLFPSPSAYDEFLWLLRMGRQRYNVRICAYCAMKTHWHQAIWIRDRDGVATAENYLRWLSTCHAVRFRYASDTRGHGHVYQDRYKSVAVHDEAHYLMLIRYIEANPLTAGIVERAGDWPWSSFAERASGRHRILESGPVPLPSDWAAIVNTRMDADEAEDSITGPEMGTEVA